MDDQRWCVTCGDRQHHDRLCRRCLLIRAGWCEAVGGVDGWFWFLPGETGRMKFDTAWHLQQRKEARGLE